MIRFKPLLSWMACVLAVFCLSPSATLDQARAAEGASVVEFYGYSDCISLRNATTEAILCPAAGGRILSYAIAGKNVLYLPPGDEGWVWDGSSTGNAPMNAGRCDIGPENIVARRTVLWQGRWTGEIIGDRQAVLRSQPDPGTGVRLERTFELAELSTQLKFTQTIINVSEQSVETCHWSRTFVNGKGTAVVPVSRPSRFPNFYVRYDPPGRLINFAPEDPNIKLVDDYLLINDHPLNPKLGFDSHRGWLAYASNQDLLFVKKFPTYPQRAYNEVAGLTISVWYPEKDMVELEPIGPRERILPNQSASFTETWYLIEHSYAGADQINPKQIDELVAALRD